MNRRNFSNGTQEQAQELFEYFDRDDFATINPEDYGYRDDGQEDDINYGGPDELALQQYVDEEFSDVDEGEFSLELTRMMC